MSNSRDQMISSIKEWILPYLRENGFTGSFPHFRRRTGQQIELVTFQFGKYGGGFVVEIAKCPPEGHTTSWGTYIPPNKVTAHDLIERLRLGSKGEGEDHWFRYDVPGASYSDVAKQVLPFLKTQAEEWWKRSE